MVAPPLLRHVLASAPFADCRAHRPMNDDRLNDDIAAQHRRELLWSEEDQRLAEQAMRDEDAA